MELPRILIACPTSSTKDYAFLEWLMHLRQIDYPKDKFDILMVDNSKENGYEKYLKSWDIKTRRVHPRQRNPVEFICDSHNVIREYFLEKDYDYLLHLESDVMIQTQTLKTLLFHSQQMNLPVINASYFYANDINKTKTILIEVIGEGKKRYLQRMEFKQCISNSNKIIQVHSCGLGCALIRKDVLKNYNIKFRYDYPRNISFPDTFFYDDLYANNIPVYIDTGIILKHNSSDWGHNLDRQTIAPNIINK